MLEIADVALFAYRLPFKQTLHLKGIAYTHRSGLLIRLASVAGKVGWGEIAPLPGFSMETMDEARLQITAMASRLRGLLIPSDWNDVDGPFAQWLDTESLMASVRYGIETAVWDLMAMRLQIPLHEAWAATPRREVPLNALLLGNTSDIVAEASALVQAGYKAIKLKVGQGPVPDDAEKVIALLTLLPPDVTLRLDANRQWSFDEAMAFADGIVSERIEYIEEPLQDSRQLPEFVKQTALPVALDESLVGMPAKTLASHSYSKAVILKPMLLGGPIPTMRIANQALAMGMMPVLSAAFESGIGTRANISFAANMGKEAIPVGLTVYHHLAADILTPRLCYAGAMVDADSLMREQRTVDLERCDQVL